MEHGTSNCFRNGPFGVKPPNDHLAAGFMLPSVVGLKPPHDAIRRNPRADLTSVLPAKQEHQQLPGFIGLRVRNCSPGWRKGLARPAGMWVMCGWPL